MSKTITKGIREQRAKVAKALAEKRAGRSVEDQLVELAKRPGESRKEKARLAKVAKPA